MIHRFSLGETTPPLHANQRLHWAAKARITADLRQSMGWKVKAARIGRHEHVTVGLEWRPARRGRRDAGENLAVLLKPLIDGMVDAGVVADDDATQVTRTMPTLLPVGEGEAGLWFTVEVAS